jgi:hypothetical protein
LAKHPLLGLKLKNSTGLHLMQGPVTVFEHGCYAGDAQIQDLQPDEERLLSYAIDLGTEVEASSLPAASRLIKVKISKGVLVSTVRLREGRVYRIKNRNDQERLLVIEHPIHPEFQLVGKARPAERARDVYRFELPVAAGQNDHLDVVEERCLTSDAQLLGADEEGLRLLAGHLGGNAHLKMVLEKAACLKAEAAAAQVKRADKERELQALSEDQGRLRANLKEMPVTAVAHKRYLDKFDKQETEIEKLQEELKALHAEEAERQAAFQAFLEGLDVEAEVDVPLPEGGPHPAVTPQVGFHGH